MMDKTYSNKHQGWRNRTVHVNGTETACMTPCHILQACGIAIEKVRGVACPNRRGLRRLESFESFNGFVDKFSRSLDGINGNLFSYKNNSQ
jgi:hypothetical protein